MLATVVVAPVVVEVAISLLLVVACLVALGSLYAYRATVKWLLLQLADKLDAIKVGVWKASGRPLAPIASALRNVAEAIDDGLSKLVGATSGGIVYLFGLIGRQVKSMVGWIAAFAETVERKIHGLILGDLPRALRGVERLTARRLAAIRTRIGKVEAAVAGALAGSIAAIDHRLDWTGRRANTAIRRITKVEKLLGAAALAGLVSVALRRLGMGWLRCRNVSKIGKRACGLDPGLLNALIADSLLFFGTFSLVQFAHELQDVTDEVAGAIHKLTRQG